MHYLAVLLLLIGIALSMAWSRQSGQLQVGAFIKHHKLIKFILVIFAIAVAILNWDWFNAVFSGWLVTSDLGEWFGLEKHSVQKNLWIPVIIIIIIGSFWWFFPKDQNNTNILVGVLILVICGTIIVSVSSDSKSVPAGCSDPEDVRKLAVAHGDVREIVVCEDGGNFIVNAKPGVQLSVAFSNKFLLEHGYQVMQDKAIEKFVRIINSPNGYIEIIPLDSHNSQYKRIGLDRIRLAITGKCSPSIRNCSKE